MFEFIGMVVVAWIGWKVLKALAAMYSSRTLDRAVTYAAGRGVPHADSAEILQHPALVKRARRDLARSSQEFAALDLSEQYGKVIAAFHAGRQEHFKQPTRESDSFVQRHARNTEQSEVANNLKANFDNLRAQSASFAEFEHKELAELEEAANNVKRLLEPQIATLEAEGIGATVDIITFAYVSALAFATSNRPVNGVEVKSILEYCFPDQRHAASIERVCGRTAWVTDMNDKSYSLGEIAQAEAAAGEGSFFVNFTRKHYRVPGMALRPGQDKYWFLEV